MIGPASAPPPMEPTPRSDVPSAGPSQLGRVSGVYGERERHLATNGDLSSLPELPEPRPLPAGVPVSILAPSTDLSFLAGGGEMGERTRAMDWATSPVGPSTAWPQSLKTAVSICLGSRHPIVVWWGNPDYTQFYNDAYIPFLGATKHPGCLGRSGRGCWSEIWPIIGPMLDGVFSTGEATWSEDLLLVMHRNLPKEETYFTFSYSPIKTASRSTI